MFFAPLQTRKSRWQVAMNQARLPPPACHRQKAGSGADMNAIRSLPDRDYAKKLTPSFKFALARLKDREEQHAVGEAVRHAVLPTREKDEKHAHHRRRGRC